MDAKDLLVNNIRNWVKLDNEIRELKKEENARKQQKKELTSKLIHIMKQNEIDCVDINDGKLCYNQHTVKKAITKKNLLDILSKYFKGDASRANEVNEFILLNREDVIKETIVRKITS
jgi:hypothetical protein